VPWSKEKRAEYMLRRYHERRERAIAYLGGVCVRCGSTSDLQIDHKDPATKEVDLTNAGVPNGRYWKEIEKCQLLCAPCHKAKSDAELTTRMHGSRAMYRRGQCRCPRCRGANAGSQRQYRSGLV
jgi:5-methylcytosine-specific restriction endonuclease McrA